MDLSPYYLYRQKNISGNFENTGFGKKYCLYNCVTMEEWQSIVALGSGAVSKRVFADGRIERNGNAKDVKLYMDLIDESIAKKKEFFGEEK